MLDAETGKLIHRQDSGLKNAVGYSEELNKKIAEARERGQKILAIHNHPNGLPPTADDCVSAARHGYSIGVVCGHNGKVYTYLPSERMYSQYECTQIHNAIALQLFGADLRI